MDKKTIPIILALLAVMMTWPMIDSKFIRPLFPEPPPRPEAEAQLPADEPQPPAPGSSLESQPDIRAAAQPPAPADAPPRIEASLSEPPEKAPADEQLWTLANNSLVISISSRGGGIKNATLKGYTALNNADSEPVHMDFSAHPALVYRGMTGLESDASFELVEHTESKIRLRTQTAAGLVLERHLSLASEYEVLVEDRLLNQSGTDWHTTRAQIQAGALEKLPGREVRGMVDLGIDTFKPGEKLPSHFGNKLPDLFKNARKATGQMPVLIEEPLPEAIDWVAVKNKYFAQIVRPQGGGLGAIILAERTQDPREQTDASYAPRTPVISHVAAALLLPEIIVPAGRDLTLTTHFYVGPKRYDILSASGYGQEAVMEFASTGFFSLFNPVMVPIKVGLLRLLNLAHDYIWPHNYGIAIILITILIRIIFWPITHKSTESMRRMAELQPLIKQLKEKYKDDAQKLQQATMALYKEHKINPMGGCLPMLIQIPVFIALFVVLRNAIELRFAHFLWVTDLSEPENLLAGVLPIPLNILPLIMVITQFIQQKLTPAAGDPQQAKMMQFLPVMFLFFFYTMPSGLVLYWTTNQVLMIIQQVFFKKKTAARKG